MSKADVDIDLIKQKWILVSITMEKSGATSLPPSLDLIKLKKIPQKRENVLYLDKIGDRHIITTKDSKGYMEILKLSSDTIDLGYHFSKPTADKDELLLTAHYVALPKTINNEKVYVFYLEDHPQDESLITSTLGYIGVLDPDEYQFLQEKNVLETEHEYGFTWGSKHVRKKYDLLKKGIYQRNEGRSNAEAVEDKFLQIIKKAADMESGLRAITIR